MNASALKKLIIPAAAVLAAGCGAGTKFVVQRDRFEPIKTVAVIEYSVPQNIEYKENPREGGGGSLLQMVAKALSKADPVRAATLAHASFCAALNEQGLSFRALTVEELKGNPGFAGLAAKTEAPAPAEEPQSGLKGKFGSFMKGMKDSLGPARAAAPENLRHFGLAKGWPKGSALTGGSKEIDFLKDAVRALGVDAVLVVNDPGFSFSCTACAGAVGSMNGAASTGSAFSAVLVDRDGNSVLEVSEWFATNGSSAVMAMSSVNPLEQDKLFTAHGRKMAAVFAELVKKKLAKG